MSKRRFTIDGGIDKAVDVIRTVDHGCGRVLRLGAEGTGPFRREAEGHREEGLLQEKPDAKAFGCRQAEAEAEGIAAGLGLAREAEGK